MDDERGAMRSGAAQGVGELEATPPQRAASPAGDAGEPSALERLHPDALNAVLQELGPVEASRVRLVSKRMREAVDGVADWRSLRLKVESAAQIERIAASFAPAQQAVAIGARQNKLRLAKGAALELTLVMQPKDHRPMDAVGALFSACSASSGGLGSVLLEVIMNMIADPSRPPLALKLDRLVVALVESLSVPDAEGGSSDTLKSFAIDIDVSGKPKSVVINFTQMLALFPRLERLRLPYTLEGPASALSTALPALRSAVVRLEEGAVLAGLSSHPALEELEIKGECLRGDKRGFAAFAAGPAARRLRKLKIFFGSWGFNMEEVCSLGRLESLETLELTIDPDPASAGDPAWEEVEALAGLAKLRCLKFNLQWGGTIRFLDALTRTVAALRERSLRDLRLEIGMDRHWGDAEVDPALEELIRAAGPALVEHVDHSEAVMCDEAFAALAACPRLRRLRLYAHALLPAEAAGLLAACPRLEWIRDLAIDLSSEREATEGLEPLRRLGPSGCALVVLCPGAGLLAEDRGRVMRLARERIRSIFPRASIEEMDPVGDPGPGP